MSTSTITSPAPPATAGGEQSHLLRIQHRTRYRYASEASFQPHRLVIRPREGHDLRVENLALAISPAAEVQWSRDIFGNSIAYAHFHSKATELFFDVDVLVRRFFDPAAPPRIRHCSSLFPLEYDALEQGIVTGYLTPVFPEEAVALKEFIATLPAPGDFACAEDFVLKIAELINGKIGYQRREVKGTQSPAATLALGTGSCRDMATLLMETLRHLGIAARFASGYLDCQATRAARGSTHAWMEAYFPELGWCGFDPTSGKRCEHRHIVTGTSHHPRGVMPISGSFTGATGSYLGMEVTVEFSSPEAG